MKLIVGLGNPGKEYEGNRHNVGFMVVEEVVRLMGGDEKWRKEGRWEGEVWNKGELVVLKPMTFMNNSGRAVRKVKDYSKINMGDVWLVHDDLDIVLGEYKIQQGKGPKIHNGVKSVEKNLGGDDFWRVRVGVDNRDGKRRQSGEEYVLKNFSQEEKEMVEGVVKKIGEDVVEKLGINLD